MTGYDELDREAPIWERRERAFEQAPDPDAVVRAQREYLEDEIEQARTEIERIRSSAQKQAEPIAQKLQRARDQLNRLRPSEDPP